MITYFFVISLLELPLQQEGFGPQHRDDFQKIAVVGGSWWLSLQMKLIAPLISGEVRNFSRAELPEAWNWIKAQSLP